MEPEDQAAAEEMAEVKQLQRQQLTLKVGFPGLQIEELQGELQLVFYSHVKAFSQYDMGLSSQI